eukprot:c19875_g1_i2.p1 GENE.c19875_g1_i2~~c19875_g1_i2.p1  ORF type:complete len:318 (+),score=123.24 c19875_g1_i2:115-1068(+)
MTTEIKKQVVLSSPPFEFLAEAMVKANPQKFVYYPTKWSKFEDSGMDCIEVGGFYPENKVRNSSVIFLASFHNNDAILSQFHVLIMLLESFIQDLTIVLPFLSMGTMERVTKEGQVATAGTIARLFSNLPPCGKPARVMIYDVHTLQNRFYLYGHALASLHSTIPLLLKVIGKPGETVDAIAFPDEGAMKRFKELFIEFPLVVCAKVRDGDTRKVTIQEGDVKNLRVMVVDDLVRSGGTLYECAKVLKTAGATHVSAFCAHAAFGQDSWKQFTAGGKKSGVIEMFYLTNSVPTVTSKLYGVEPFVVLDLTETIMNDL